MLFTFLAMLFCHVIDDYFLQGFLAKGKQKSWWKEQKDYSCLYKFDYIVCLIMHSIEWSFMIMLPIAIRFNFEVPWEFGLMFVYNVIIHAIIDHLKANRKIINLVIDQTLHIMQILITFFALGVVQ